MMEERNSVVGARKDTFDTTDTDALSVNTANDDNENPVSEKTILPPQSQSQPQPQLAIVAHLNDDGGITSGSLVFVTDTSELTNPTFAGLPASSSSFSIPMVIQHEHQNPAAKASAPAPQKNTPSYVFRNVPIIVPSSSSRSTQSQEEVSALKNSEQQQQQQQQQQPQQIHSSQPPTAANNPIVDTVPTPSKLHRPTSPTGESVATDVAFASRDVNASNETNATTLGTYAKQLAQDAQDFMRDSRRTEIVNFEQIERIKKMHKTFADGSIFSFNYNTLLFVASILAGLGLVSDSTTTIIASMLVSPIMGPVVGIAYGATIRDKQLIKIATKTEFLSLFACVVIGALIALFTGPTALSQEWPTSEMKVRGTWQNFLVALPIAFFSGLGVAVGLLDDQVSSLVGVAISASLLPPAVNTGAMLVAMRYANTDWWQDDERPIDVQSNTTSTYDVEKENEVKNQFREAAFVSFLLSVANIVLVAISSMLMFRLKERLPIASKKVFWNDLGTARKIYRDLAVISLDDGSEVGNNDNTSMNNNKNESLRSTNTGGGNQFSSVIARNTITASIPEGKEEEEEDESAAGAVI